MSTVEAIRVQEVIACARSFVRATTKERAARKKTEENDDDNDDVEDTALAATFSHASKNGDDGTVETEVFLRALYTAVDESMQRLVESETRVQRSTPGRRPGASARAAPVPGASPRSRAR